jgi:hypothetical protein
MGYAMDKEKKQKTSKFWYWSGKILGPLEDKKLSRAPCIVFNQDGRQAKNRKKGDEILIVHCCSSISQNELKF